MNLINLFYLICFIFISTLECKTINVSTSTELTKALNRAAAGDIITLADGTYKGRFKTSQNGTQTQRITLKGSKNAILTNPNDDLLFLSGSWWILDGFTIFNVSRAIVCEYASNNILQNLKVSHTDHAAIKFRKNSTDNIVQDSSISYTGRAQPENGEAIYIGASISHWTDQYSPDRSNRNRIRNNHFGPFVSSESVDIKEGTEGTVFENNYINGTGMDDKNYSLSWVSLKGANTVIQNNTGFYSVLDGVSVRKIPNKMAVSGCGNKFLNNVCYNIGKGGKCINLSLVTCQNEDLNNLSLNLNNNNSILIG